MSFGYQPPVSILLQSARVFRYVDLFSIEQRGIERTGFFAIFEADLFL
jgi:hypothetical protein